MPVVNLGEWGYPSGQDAPRYKCRIHEVVNAMLKIEIRNEQYELVSDRRYCLICVDAFFQKHLDPLIKVSPEELQNVTNIYST